MTTTVEADSEIGKQLEQVVKDHVSTFGLDDSLDDVAQYIVVLLTNNKPIPEMTQELASIFGDKFDDEFSTWAYAQLDQLVNGGNEPASVEKPEPQNGFGGYVDDSYTARGQRFNRQRQNGVTKNFGQKKNIGGPRSLGGHVVARNQPRNRNMENQIEQDISMGEDGSEGQGDFNNLEVGGENKRRERCRHWPNCSYPGCKFPHPTRPCINFTQGNCTHARGTCPYLHIGEDPLPGINGAFVPPTGVMDLKNPLGGGWANGVPVPPPELMMMMGGGGGGGGRGGRFNRQGGNRRNDYNNGNEGFQQRNEPQLPSIIICKYRDKCANQQCQFGHPTPSNPAAKVRVMEWCPEDTQCNNASCEYAHKSGSLVRAPEPIPDRVLETCRFADGCTNPKCRYRHPRTPIRCKNGADCQRPDCFFTHPLKEMCKYGINCRNTTCLYQHSAERDEAMKQGGTSNTWVNQESQQQQNDASHLSERQFATEGAEEKMVI